LVQVPLTLDDVLHPQAGDFIVDNDGHTIDWVYLRNVLDWWLAAITGAVVLSNCRINWSVKGLRATGPDIAVIFNVRERKRWSTFNCAKEGTRPALVIEVTSPKTRKNDLVAKVEIHRRAQVPYYIIVDQQTEGETPKLRLLGYQLVSKDYVPMEPDAHGRLWLEPVKLWLGIEDYRVRCYDENGKVIRDFREARLKQLAAEQEVLDAKKETDSARKEADSAREEAKKLAAAVAAAEAHAAAMEAELNRLKGQRP
jgi:Uma2 family endonuclease